MISLSSDVVFITAKFVFDLIVVHLASPFVRFIDVIQPEVIVDRLGREHAREEIRKRLHTADRAVAANADQALDAELRQAFA